MHTHPTLTYPPIPFFSLPVPPHSNPSIHPTHPSHPPLRQTPHIPAAAAAAAAPAGATEGRKKRRSHARRFMLWRSRRAAQGRQWGGADPSWQLKEGTRGPAGTDAVRLAPLPGAADRGGRRHVHGARGERRRQRPQRGAPKRARQSEEGGKPEKSPVGPGAPAAVRVAPLAAPLMPGMPTADRPGAGPAD